MLVTADCVNDVKINHDGKTIASMSLYKGKTTEHDMPNDCLEFGKGRETHVHCTAIPFQFEQTNTFFFFCCFHLANGKPTNSTRKLIRFLR